MSPNDCSRPPAQRVRDANSLSTPGFSRQTALLRGVSCVTKERSLLTEFPTPGAVERLLLPEVFTVGVIAFPHHVLVGDGNPVC